MIHKKHLSLITISLVLVLGLMFLPGVKVLSDPEPSDSEPLIRLKEPQVMFGDEADDFTVDDDGPADWSSLKRAVKAARPGSMIRVAPGEYEGQVFVDDNDVTILGSGPGKTVIESDKLPLIISNVAHTSLKGVTIRYTGDKPLPAVVIRNSTVVLENSVITGAKLAGVEIYGPGEPVLMGNRIMDNQKSGVLIHDGAAPVLSGNHILENGKSQKSDNNSSAGVEVRGMAGAIMRDNLIEANGGSGVFASEGARLIASDNLIVRNGYHGFSITGSAGGSSSNSTEIQERPTSADLKSNNVVGNRQIGVRIRGDSISARVLGNLVARNTVGLLSDNPESTTYRRNFVAFNSYNYELKGPASGGTELYSQLILHPDYSSLRRMFEGIIVASSEGKFIYAHEESIRTLQRIHLTVGDLYNQLGFGFKEAALSQYRSVLRITNRTNLAETAYQKLTRLKQ